MGLPETQSYIRELTARILLEKQLYVGDDMGLPLAVHVFPGV